MMAVEEPPHADLREPAGHARTPRTRPRAGSAEQRLGPPRSRSFRGSRGSRLGPRSTAPRPGLGARRTRRLSRLCLSGSGARRASRATPWRASPPREATSWMPPRWWRNTSRGARTVPIDASREPGVAAPRGRSSRARAWTSTGAPSSLFAASRHRASDERETRDVIRHDARHGSGRSRDGGEAEAPGDESEARKNRRRRCRRNRRPRRFAELWRTLSTRATIPRPADSP